MISDLKAVANIPPYEHGFGYGDLLILDRSIQYLSKNFLSSSKLNKQDRFERIATIFGSDTSNAVYKLSEGVLFSRSL